MKWSEGDRWTLTMDLPPGKHEFKVGGCWAGRRVLAEAGAAMWQLHRRRRWAAAAASSAPLSSFSGPSACPTQDFTPQHSTNVFTLLQVAVAQGDSLVHYEDGPNRTLQVHVVEHQCCRLCTVGMLNSVQCRRRAYLLLPPLLLPRMRRRCSASQLTRMHCRPL